MRTKKSKKESAKRISHFRLFLSISIFTPIAIILLIIGAITNSNIQPEVIEDIVETVETNYKLSENPVPAYIQDDRGGITEDNSIPTMEEVDGGQFEDEATGVSEKDTEYEDLGWSEWYPTDTPEAFKNATLGKCIRAGNIYGSQCVSLARVYWWSYADRDVSTCGTGMAKGMMNCSAENAGDDFEVYGAESKDEIQAGDWLVFTGGQYGHIGMALGPVVNGYVTLLGENQGGRACEGGGAATNIINLNIKNLIGFYRPKAYIKVIPVSPDTGMVK